MERLGSYAWTRETGGNLSRAERRRLVGAIAREYHRLIVDRLRLTLGRVPDAARRIDPDSIVPPDSKFARDAEAACSEQPQPVVGHSYRTWILGTALARLDGAELDPEQFYVGSLLHDAGIAEPTPNRCFTLGGAEAALAVAERCGIDPSRAEAIADGVCGHITPGARAEVDGPLALYIQSGAMADLLGLRRCDVAPAVRERADSKHPRGEVSRQISGMWRAEAKAVPKGRAALLERWARFSLAARFGPSR